MSNRPNSNLSGKLKPFKLLQLFRLTQSASLECNLFDKLLKQWIIYEDSSMVKTLSSTGRTVPMFALNNRKKRLRQALYANPTSDSFEDSSAFTLNNAGEGYFDASEVAIPQKRFQRLQPPNSSNNEKNVNGTSSFLRQNQESICGSGRSGSSFPCSGRYYGTNQIGAQLRQPIKQQTHSFLINSMDSPPTNYPSSNKFVF